MAGMGINVLIVDDHHGFRILARKLLEGDGYHVVGEASDGAAGVAAVAMLKPDLVLLDIQLPDHDGFEITRQLIERAPSCQVVLISSRDASDYGRCLEQSGARGFIPKDQLCTAALTELLGNI
jgi:two-component system, chemotaxis family, chemotaxis protein CheY